MNETHNPDVLSCLANLSNDEVFTPPSVVNQMLDMLPQELFRSSKTTFLDIGCKSGVFLREITKRLIAGLAEEMPDLQTRVDHILHKQVFGIATTELTSLVSRRTLYCSKYPNCRYSASRFETVEGNIRFRNIPHTFVNGRCKWCGASEEQFGDAKRKGLETHAYEFIHTDHPEEIFKMKFDVIVGNPPYQLSCASENSSDSNAAFASAIYPKFIEQARKLFPRQLIMITPSRWMTKTGQGIEGKWVDEMIKGNHIKELHDFIDSAECFPGVDIMGGVSYFLYSEDYVGKCRFVEHSKDKISEVVDFLDPYDAGIVVRELAARKILEKVQKVDGLNFHQNSFARMVSPGHFYDKAGVLSTNWDGYSRVKKDGYVVKYYLNKRLESEGCAWIKTSHIPKHRETLDLHKVYIPKANGSFGENSTILGVPFYGEPGSVCSQTYLVIGYDQGEKHLSKKCCFNMISYIKTKFFRYMVSIKKKTQDAPSSVYQFVPMQDFSKPWTDKELYEKYNLNADEIKFIESMIKPME